MTQAQEIAKGLSERQRAILRDEPWYGARGWKLKRPRWWLYTFGLAVPGSSYLTPLGLEVRAILQEQAANG
jgi:hypothetical protein